jgi:hypothetical protein
MGVMFPDTHEEVHVLAFWSQARRMRKVISFCQSGGMEIFAYVVFRRTSIVVRCTMRYYNIYTSNMCVLLQLTVFLNAVPGFIF